MSKHTPGPWSHHQPDMSIHGENHHIADVYSPEIMVADGVIGEVEEEGLANARLITAAPDMLEALKSILPETECHCNPAYVDRGLHESNSLCHHESEIRAAIAKATGQEESK